MEPQDCPDQVKFIPWIAARATWATSASGNAMSAFLPPSSRVTCLTPVSAAAFWIDRPVGSLPVKPIRRTFGCRTIASGTAGPLPVTMFTTPGGKISAIRSASSSADSGVASAGFSTTALPAMSGAAILVAANISGWLKGMILPTTP